MLGPVCLGALGGLLRSGQGTQILVQVHLREDADQIQAALSFVTFPGFLYNLVFPPFSVDIVEIMRTVWVKGYLKHLTLPVAII